jgi:uncharacterized protein (DUF427 family)
VPHGVAGRRGTDARRDARHDDGRLDCAEISAVAWPVLRAGIHGAITVDDAETHRAMRDLAAHGLRIGDCGAAPVAALRALAQEPACAALRDALGLDHTTRVLLVATEGPTDPDAYARVVTGAGSLDGGLRATGPRLAVPARTRRRPSARREVALPLGRTIAAMPGFVPPATRLEPTPRWIRVRAGDTWIADSRRAQLLVQYGPRGLPTYLLPEEDVRTDLLTPDGDLELGGTRLEGVARQVDDHWTFAWDGRVQWFEEATEVFVHARDTRHRVDAMASERHVEIRVAGELIAESRAPHALFETSLPVRWYLPADDVRTELLEPSEHVTSCPYKGTARYWHVRAGGELHRDLAWSYPDPIAENPRIRDLIAFFDEHVDVTVDGERQRRPVTPWSQT